MIQKETGKTLSLEEDFADIYRLHVLGEEVNHPGSLSDETLLLDAPIICGDLRLYRLTPGAIIWIEQINSWFESEPVMISYALIYAMANCRSKEFRELSEKADCRKKILKWVRDIDGTSFDSLDRCIDHLMPREASRKPEDDDEGGMGPVLSMLLAEIGHTPNFWLHEVSLDLVGEILSGISKIKFDKNSDGKTPNPFDPYMVASKEFHLFKIDLMKRHGA